MLKIAIKIWKCRWMLRSLSSTVFFNFRMLPFRQAIHLPILLYKPRFAGISGKIIIDAPISTGMIRLGVNLVPIYPNDGIMIQCNTIVFQGTATIGNGSAISVGKCGTLKIGNNFSTTAALKLICFHKVNIGNNVLIGWNCMICDTDFHKLSYLGTSQSKYSGYGPIFIGDNVWIANSCKLYKHTSVPPNNIVGADTVLNKLINNADYSLIYNHRSTTVKSTGAYLDRNDDVIQYKD